MKMIGIPDSEQRFMRMELFVFCQKKLYDICVDIWKEGKDPYEFFQTAAVQTGPVYVCP